MAMLCRGALPNTAIDVVVFSPSAFVVPTFRRKAFLMLRRRFRGAPHDASAGHFILPQLR